MTVKSTLCLLLTLAASAAHSQSSGPWTPVSSPSVPAASLNTSYQTLQVVEPTTVWGWAHTSQARGPSEDRLLVSTTDGQSWQLATVAKSDRTNTYSGDVVLDAWMTDDQHAWVLAQDVTTAALTLKRSSTGLQGFSIGPAPANAAKIRFFSATTGIILGFSASAATWPLYRTTNGGATWQLLSVALPHLPNDQPSSLTLLGAALWVTTSQGQLLRTTDAGLTWTISTLPLGGQTSVVAFRDALHGLLLGAAGQLLQTADAGQTWQSVTSTGPRRTSGLVAVPGSAGTYLSFDGKCESNCAIRGSAISTDNGQTWRGLENTIYHTAMTAGPGPRVWSGSYAQANLYRASSLLLSTRAARAAEASLAWPNPTTGQLHFAAQPQARTFTLLDATGRVQGRYTLPAQATTLDLSGCQPGLYLLQSSATSGTRCQRLLVTAP